MANMAKDISIDYPWSYSYSALDSGLPKLSVEVIEYVTVLLLCFGIVPQYVSPLVFVIVMVLLCPS